MENNRTPEEQQLIGFVEFCMDYFLWETLTTEILQKYFEILEKEKRK